MRSKKTPSSPEPPTAMDLLDTEELVGWLVMLMGITLIFVGSSSVVNGVWNWPEKRAKALKRFRQVWKMTGKHDFSVFYQDFPSTVSEMIGNVDAPGGAIAKALSTPGLVLWMIGATFVASNPPAGTTYAMVCLNTLSKLSGPMGLYIVLLTPVVTLLKDLLSGVRVSEHASQYHFQTSFFWHNAGFGIMLLPVIFLDLPRTIYAVFKFHVFLANDGKLVGGEVELTILHYVRLALILPMLVMFVKFQKLMGERGNPQGARLRNFRINLIERAILLSICWFHLIGGMPQVNNPKFVESGVKTSDLPVPVLLSMLVLAFIFWRTTYRILSLTYQSLTFESIDWAGSKQKEFEKAWTPLKKGLAAALSNKDSQGLYSTSIVQAGEHDANDTLQFAHSAKGKGVGGNMPKVRMFVVFPSLIERDGAIDVDEMSVGDLLDFNAFIATTLTTMPGADTLHVPMGSKAKFGRAVPLVYISCTDHATAVRALSASVPANAEDMVPAADEVAIDITDRVLFESKLPKGKTFVDVLQSGACEALWGFLCSQMAETAVRVRGFTTNDEMIDVIRTGTPAFYEVQVRDVLSTTPRFVLRTTSDNLASLTQLRVPQGDPPKPKGISSIATGLVSKKNEAKPSMWEATAKTAQSLSSASSSLVTMGERWVEPHPSHLLAKSNKAD